MRLRAPGPFVICVGLAVFLPAPGAATSSAEKSAEVSAIRKAREVFNLAIVRKDASAIAALLAPTYHIVTGRSDQFHGSEEQRGKWAEWFRSDPTMVYRRTAREVTVNESWGLAQETGEWSGKYTASGRQVMASGVYAAKWQRAAGGRWLLQAEVFTTLKCEGPAEGCAPPSPMR